MNVDVPLYLAESLNVLSGPTFEYLGSIESWIKDKGFAPNPVEKGQLENVGDFYFEQLDSGYYCVVRLPRDVGLMLKLTMGGK